MQQFSTSPTKSGPCCRAKGVDTVRSKAAPKTLRMRTRCAHTIRARTRRRVFAIDGRGGDNIKTVADRGFAFTQRVRPVRCGSCAALSRSPLDVSNDSPRRIEDCRTLIRKRPRIAKSEDLSNRLWSFRHPTSETLPPDHSGVNGDNFPDREPMRAAPIKGVSND